MDPLIILTGLAALGTLLTVLFLIVPLSPLAIWLTTFLVFGGLLFWHRRQQ